MRAPLRPADVDDDARGVASSDPGTAAAAMRNRAGRLALYPAGTIATHACANVDIVSRADAVCVPRREGGATRAHIKYEVLSDIARRFCNF